MNGPRGYQNERSGDRATRLPTHARLPQEWASPSIDRAAKRTGCKGSTGSSPHLPRLIAVACIIFFASYFSVVFFPVSTFRYLHDRRESTLKPCIRRFLNTTKYVFYFIIASFVPHRASFAHVGGCTKHTQRGGAATVIHNVLSHCSTALISCIMANPV